MSTAIFLLLALSPHFVVSYNVDTSRPIIYKDPESKGTNYFGYSVSLISGKIGASSRSSLLVGAPQFFNGIGRVYRCADSPTKGQNTSSCQALEICNTKGPKPGWLGASTATGATSDSTVCAPRTIIPMKANSDSGVFLFNFLNLHGVCYHVRDTKGKCTLSLGYDPTTSGPKGLNSAYGFSVSYVGRNGSASHRGTHLIGLPVHDTVNIEPGGNTRPTSVPGPDHANYGYSVSSGYFFQSRKLYYVVGAPSYMRKGMVDVFSVDEVRSRRTITINGSVFGEYFGASLATGDFDGDGRDDLAVGAPHWGEVDFGRVYIYHSKNHENFEQGQTLQGETRNGQFGYILASADLDHDGCSDLIVSAPWEDSGAVYVYYGRRDFNEDNPTSQTIQRIEPSAFKHDDHIQRFGFSLSQPVDIDGNGYPDLAIGAYKSGHAIVVRSRPVIGTKVELGSDPVMLKKSTKSFTVCVCVSYEGIGAPESLDLSFDMRVDAKHNRIENGSSKGFDASFFSKNRTCVNTTMSLITSKDLRFLDPIEVELTHSIKKGAGGSEIDAVLNRRSSNRMEPLTIPFNTSCERGPVCNARLAIDASFGGVGENNVWVVGSGDISLNIMVMNEDEPAYQTQITIEITPGSRLRRTIELCKTVTDFSLICDVGNPLVKGKPKSFTVELDMSDIDKVSAGPPMLIFSITKSTRSIDHGAGSPTTILKLYTKHVARVILTGATETRYIDYGRTVAKSKIPIRHAYQILKSGSSPITEAYLTIDVPTFMIGRNYSFLNINDTKLMHSSGQTLECSINDPPSKEDVPSRTPREIYDDIDETMFTNSDLPTPMENESVDDDLGKDTLKSGLIGRIQTTDRTVYLNCSTEGVSCKRLTCGFKVSKTHEDLENMVLDMIFNAEAFYRSEEDSLTIKFHTNASVDIMSPVISDSSPIRNWTASATTFIYNIAEAKKLDTWVIPASILLGIILCFAVAIILFMVGFFNRSKKFEATKAKQPQSINLQDKQNVSDNVETDPYG